MGILSTTHKRLPSATGFMCRSAGGSPNSRHATATAAGLPSEGKRNGSPAQASFWGQGSAQGSFHQTAVRRRSGVLRVDLGPLLRGRDGLGLVVLPVLGHVLGQGVVRVGGAHERLDAAWRRVGAACRCVARLQDWRAEQLPLESVRSSCASHPSTRKTAAPAAPPARSTHAPRPLRRRSRRPGRSTQPRAPQKHGADLQRRAPLVFQDVKADAAEPVHIGVVDLGQETDLSCDKGGGAKRGGLRVAVATARPAALAASEPQPRASCELTDQQRPPLAATSDTPRARTALA
jgi:hypothetical protein